MWISRLSEFMHLKISFMLVIALVLSNCGELTYKRGASVKDLESTKNACLAKDSSQTAIDKCMEEKGWFVHNLSKEDLVEIKDDTLATEPIIEVSTNQDNRQFVKSVTTSNKVTASGQIPTPSSSIGSEQISPAVKKPIDYMGKFKINSWWKLGGKSENLDLSIRQCTEKLGEPHRPTKNINIVTRAFLQCMNEKGWRGLREKL